MTKYKAIICDIDGTLVKVDPNAMPSQAVKQAIFDAQKKGIYVTLASGRPFWMMDKLVKLLNLNVPIISDNGAVITDSKTQKVLWQSTLSANIVRQIIEIIKTEKLYRITTSKDNQDCNNPTTVADDALVRKLSVHDISYEQAEKYTKQILQISSNIAIVKAASYKGEQYTDLYISNKLATKANAVKEFAKILNISTSETIGIGDGHNDVPLFDNVGLKIAMKNAVQELKDLADYIAPSIDDDGLAHVLNKFF